MPMALGIASHPQANGHGRRKFRTAARDANAIAARLSQVQNCRRPQVALGVRGSIDAHLGDHGSHADVVA
jgi:hypothetical protein